MDIINYYAKLFRFQHPFLLLVLAIDFLFPSSNNNSIMSYTHQRIPFHKIKKRLKTRAAFRSCIQLKNCPFE